MKMKYERPVMKAELYQVNSFVAACGDPDFIGKRTSITLGSGEGADTGKWFNVPSGGSDFDNATPITGDMSAYDGLTFTTKTEQWSESANKWQYYWTATSGSDTYYLEYSAGWSDTTNKKDDVFVLYKEDAASSGRDDLYDALYNQNKADQLDINWNWRGENESEQWSLIYGTHMPNNFDTLIGGIIFNTKIIQKS